MQGRTSGETKAADVAGVRRNLRLDQDDIEGGGVMDCWSNGVLDLKRLPHYSTTPPLHCFYNLLATNFSSFTISAANFRIPSDVFSVAIALSLNRYRNVFSSISRRSHFASFAFS